MNKLCVALATAGCLADAAAEPLAAGAPFSLLEPGADTARLFVAADRQALLAEALRDGASPLRLEVLPAAPLWHAPWTSGGRRYLSSAEFEQKIGHGNGVLRLGLLRETGGTPGGQSMSMLLNTRLATRFTSVSLGYALSPSSALVATASYGRSEGIGSPDSLLAQVSAVRTLAYSAGYVQRQVFSGNDRLALTWSVPAKVRNGVAGTVDAGVALTASGQAALGVARLNLRPTATEHDLEFSYSRVVGRDGSQGRLTGAVMWRLNPGHDANARPDLLLGVRYSYGF